MIYAEDEPFGESAAFLRAGIIASTIANVNRDPKKSEPFTPSDFMPNVRKRKPTLTAGKHLAADLRAAFPERVKDG